MTEAWPANVAAETLAKLHADYREPPAEYVQKLIKRWTDKRGTEREIELDYIGHARITDILLAVDPQWTWEPLGLDEKGRPALIAADGRPVGLWINLTVCGVTRPAYGSCSADANDPIKELIGDALRNGAMRFGIGLALWIREQ